MEYQELGKSGIKVSEVSLGTWTISGGNWGKTDDEESIEVIRTAVDIGMNYIDTAHAYGRGHSEELIGRALKDRRKDAVICTKVVNRWDEAEQKMVTDCSYDSIMREFEKGLKRLQTNYVDVYLIHSFDPNVPIKETMRALRKLQDEKVVKAVGVSRYNIDQLKEAADNIRIDVVQYPMNIFRRKEISPLLDYCHEENISVMAYAALAKGLLTGKFNGTETFPDNDNRSRNPMFQGGEFKKRVEAVERIRSIAEKHGKTLAQLAVNWNLCQPAVATALVGARTPNQVKDNAGGSGWRLAPEDLEEIEGIVADLEEPDF